MASHDQQMTSIEAEHSKVLAEMEERQTELLERIKVLN